MATMQPYSLEIESLLKELEPLEIGAAKKADPFKTAWKLYYVAERAVKLAEREAGLYPSACIMVYSILGTIEGIEKRSEGVRFEADSSDAGSEGNLPSIYCRQRLDYLLSYAWIPTAPTATVAEARAESGSAGLLGE